MLTWYLGLGFLDLLGISYFNQNPGHRLHYTYSSIWNAEWPPLLKKLYGLLFSLYFGCFLFCLWKWDLPPVCSSSCLLLSYYYFAIISKEPFKQYYIFPNSSAKAVKFDFAVKWLRSSQGHHLYKLCRPQAPMLHAKFQNHKTSDSNEKKLKIFIIYRRGIHLGLMTWPSI